jgi:hypothetical protein
MLTESECDRPCQAEQDEVYARLAAKSPKPKSSSFILRKGNDHALFTVHEHCVYVSYAYGKDIRMTLEKGRERYAYLLTGGYKKN